MIGLPEIWHGAITFRHGEKGDDYDNPICQNTRPALHDGRAVGAEWRHSGGGKRRDAARPCLAHPAILCRYVRAVEAATREAGEAKGGDTQAAAQGSMMRVARGGSTGRA